MDASKLFPSSVPNIDWTLLRWTAYLSLQFYLPLPNRAVNSQASIPFYFIIRSRKPIVDWTHFSRSFHKSLLWKHTLQPSFFISFMTWEVLVNVTSWRINLQRQFASCYCPQTTNVQSLDSDVTQVGTHIDKIVMMPVSDWCLAASLPPPNEENSLILYPLLLQNISHCFLFSSKHLSHQSLLNISSLSHWSLFGPQSKLE